MEAPEVPLEQVQEHLSEHAHEAKDRFISSIAVSTAIIAAFAAVASLLAGDHADEAMISQIQSSDQWALFQAKSIKSAVLTTKMALLEAQGQKVNPKDEEKLADYAKDHDEIEKEAKALDAEAKEHLGRHKLLASGVTLLQIAIAVGAISALTKRRAFWAVSLLFGLGGVGFLVWEMFFFAAKPG